MTFMKTKETHILECPNCFHRMATNEMNDELFRPAPNVAKAMDFTICAACGSLLRFESEKIVRLATEEDTEDLHPIQRELFDWSRRLVLSEDYQRKFKEGTLSRDRRT